MNRFLQYRDNNYFNTTDTYLILTNSKQFITVTVYFINGNWYSNNKSNHIIKRNDRLEYKMITVKCINCKELLIIN